MPPLDHATLQAVLDKQGMPNTTENLNRIAQFAAVAPDMLAKYLGQGTDAAAMQGGNGTNAAIDASIAQTDPRLAQLAGPNPLSVTVDPNTGMSNVGPGLVRDTGNGGRRGTVTVGPPTKAGPSPSRQGNYGDATTPRPQESMPTDPVTMGSTGYSGGGDPRDPSAGAAPPPGGTNWLLPAILGLFGAGGGAAALARSGGAPQAGGAPPAPPQVGSGQVPPNRQLPPPGPGNRPPDNSGAPPPPPPRQAGQPMQPGPGQTAEDVARLQAQVDAENAQAKALQEQMAAREKARANTADLARRAKGATGRRP